MNVKKAIKILKSAGYPVEGSSDEWIVFQDTYTNRELIGWARCYTSDVGTPWKKNVKFFRHRNNRSKTRHWIVSEKFENFSPGMLAKDSNIWYWD